MPLPFSLPQRPSLPSLSWATGSSGAGSDTKTDEKQPKSAPPRTSHHSVTSSIRRLSGSRSIRHTSVVLSRPTTPANRSPLSAGFGLPGVEDDDPFGVLALQKAGLHIKEAGTNNRPGSDAFQYRPAPSSPIWRSSMASAMSRASRPSFEGRSSIMTGRSYAHSRTGSSGTTGTVDTSAQASDVDVFDKSSIRGMSPVRETSRSVIPSFDAAAVKTGESAKSYLGTKPDPLLLNDNDFKRRDETPSPRSKLAVVNEDTMEDTIRENSSARTTKAIVRTNTDERFESDLERLARELREMADEHEEEQRKSQDSRLARIDMIADGETVAATEDDSEDAKTPQRLSTKSFAKVVVQNGQLKERPGEAERSLPVRSDTLTQASASADQCDDEFADEENEDDGESDDDYDSFDDEEPVIIEQAVQTAAPVNVRPRNLGAASLQARAQIVSVHLPPPPKVPSRNPRRARQTEPTETLTEGSEQETDQQTSPADSHDNDSTSTYSLEHDRDSFDDGQDIMTQTSQGSEAGSTQATPTREKTFESISRQMERSVSDEQRRSRLDNGRETAQQAPVISIEAPDADRIDNGVPRSQASATEEHICPSKRECSICGPEPVKQLSLPTPEIPDRRRPFSFEAEANVEECIAKASPDVSSDTSTSGKITDPHKTVPNTPQSPFGIKETAGKPIIIPALPADDTSDYEEDFS